MEKLLAFIADYRENNGNSVDELEHQPTALEFMRQVGQNRPLVIRRSCTPLKRTWSEQYLADKLGDTPVPIAITPDGRADSIVNGRFTLPATEEMTMRDFLSSLRKPADAHEPVRYLQSQNSNLTDGPLDVLKDDLHPPPEYALDVFGTEPDATNIWIGNHRSVSSAHRDPYDNIYTVLQGSKTFSLWPPHEVACLYERNVHTSAWQCDSSGVFSQNMQDSEPIPWIHIDADTPDYGRFPLFRHCQPLQVTLRPGDVLYLPHLWYHQVSQAGQEITIALNWWFDMSYSGADCFCLLNAVLLQSSFFKEEIVKMFSKLSLIVAAVVALSSLASATTSREALVKRVSTGGGNLDCYIAYNPVDVTYMDAFAFTFSNGDFTTVSQLAPHSVIASSVPGDANSVTWRMKNTDAKGNTDDLTFLIEYSGLMPTGVKLLSASHNGHDGFNFYDLTCGNVKVPHLG
ncbi:uncharacterized protein L969DRAFT_50506 [Mixia osmundae IAM 14324]|uniref:JmjC domain-containing protein n=1 Tax=Mixia osmundae (strain CBS 9802 / IAM 14324 / JCM 22182 / KY 12970) TaxID=764103 RepID=G7E175_MIXOS|nr:uncharacterized protein L969DRAFT_50506 [Mixia osmundae IAM 14324]KEI38776.1 hypothetical protein L969DRAFT_50506 [Mixia osmundae IAM 14324]GAA96585.1 hypothetical protein E5Q_03255 [Mixia osmundae IAM 14324]